MTGYEICAIIWFSSPLLIDAVYIIYIQIWFSFKGFSRNYPWEPYTWWPKTCLHSDTRYRHNQTVHWRCRNLPYMGLCGACWISCLAQYVSWCGKFDFHHRVRSNKGTTCQRCKYITTISIKLSPKTFIFKQYATFFSQPCRETICCRCPHYLIIILMRMLIE